MFSYFVRIILKPKFNRPNYSCILLNKQVCNFNFPDSYIWNIRDECRLAAFPVITTVHQMNSALLMAALDAQHEENFGLAEAGADRSNPTIIKPSNRLTLALPALFILQHFNRSATRKCIQQNASNTHKVQVRQTAA